MALKSVMITIFCFTKFCIIHALLGYYTWLITIFSGVSATAHTNLNVKNMLSATLLPVRWIRQFLFFFSLQQYWKYWKRTKNCEKSIIRMKILSLLNIANFDKWSPNFFFQSFEKKKASFIKNSSKSQNFMKGSAGKNANFIKGSWEKRKFREKITR